MNKRIEELSKLIKQVDATLNTFKESDHPDNITQADSELLSGILIDLGAAQQSCLKASIKLTDVSSKYVEHLAPVELVKAFDPWSNITATNNKDGLKDLDEYMENRKNNI